jgi:VanZ family protein
VRLPRAPVTDKTAHFIAYFVLGCLLGAAMWISNPDRRGIALWVLAICAAYGAIDEVTQDWVGRYCELADWFADIIGAGCAAAVITAFRMIRGTAYSNRG